MPPATSVRSQQHARASWPPRTSSPRRRTPRGGGLPAKLPANELDPNAQRAKPALAARALQMVCRLLAYNAELDLARRLNS